MNRDSKKRIKLELFRIKKFIEGSVAFAFDVNYSESDMKFIDELELTEYHIKTLDNDRINILSDLREKGETSYPIDFWEKELKQKYRLFIIMLGIIDEKINNVVENENTIKSINGLIDYRTDLVQKYSQFTTTKTISEIDNAIKNYPINKIFDEQIELKSTRNLCYEFYKDYEFGKKLSSDINMDLIINFYEILIDNLIINRNEKNKYINKTRK